MLNATDLVGHPDGVEAAVAAVRASGLRVTGFQVLRDFEGLSGHLHDYKVDIAKSMLEMCAALGSKRAAGLLVDLGARERRPAMLIARDLRKLAMLAVPLGIKVAYEGLSWGRHINEFTAGLGRRAAPTRPNLGTRHRLVPHLRHKTPLDVLDDDRPRQDLPRAAGRLHVAGDAHARGAHRDRAPLPRLSRARACTARRLPSWCRRLDAMGYRGDYSFEVFNDDYRQLPLSMVAERARQSVRWIASVVSRRSLPARRTGPTSRWTGQR